MPLARIYKDLSEVSEINHEAVDSAFLEFQEEVSEGDNGRTPQISPAPERPVSLPPNNNASDSQRPLRFTHHLQRGVALVDIIENEFWQKEPAFKEYLRLGYNRNALDRDALGLLRGMLQQHSSADNHPARQKIRRPAEDYLQALTALTFPQETTPDLQQAFDQANNLTTLLRLTLDAQDAAGAVNWQERTAKVDEEVNQQLHVLREETIKNLRAHPASAVSREEHLRSKDELTRLLFSEPHDLAGESAKLRKLKRSRLAEDRLMRTKLAAWLDSCAEQIHSGAKEAGKYATEILLGPDLPSPSLFDKTDPYLTRMAMIISPLSVALKEAAAALRLQAADLRAEQEESPGLPDEMDVFIRQAPGVQRIGLTVRQGGKRNGLDQAALRQVRGLLQQSSSADNHRAWQSLLIPAEHYLQTLAELTLPQETTPDLQQAVDQANNITATLRLALKARDAAGTISLRSKLKAWLNSTAGQIDDCAGEGGSYATGVLTGRKIGKADPYLTRIAMVINPLSLALKEAALALRQQAADLGPVQAVDKGAWDETVAFIRQAPSVQWTRIKGYVNAARGAGLELRKKAGKIGPHLGRQPVVYSAGVKRAAKETGLLLLEELHQIERRIKLLPAAAWDLQESVEQHQNVQTQTVAGSPRRVLNAVLDEPLKQEAARWQEKIAQSEAKLSALLSPVVLYAEEKWANDLYYQLSTVLRQAQPAKGEWQGNGKFDEIMTAAIGKFSRIAREIDASALRLARHGHAGGADLNKQIRGWLQDLDLVKKRIDAGMASITGDSPGYYSRAGMLARGMAEWAEELKQDYLRETMPEDKSAAAAGFDRALLGIVDKNSFVFSKKSDPQAKVFRLRLERELHHAAQKTTTWPATPEEILAGSRSVGDDFRRLAQKRVVSGAISAALSQGFELVSSPASLSGRIIMRSIRTGHVLYEGLKEIDRGVRFGRGSAGNIKKRFIQNQLSRAGLGLSLSISPLAGWGISAVITGTRLYKENNYARVLVTETLNDLPEDLLWRGGYAVGYRIVNGVYAQVQKRAIAAEIEKIEEEYNQLADTPKITLGSGVTFHIEGSREFRVAVRLHLKELERHPSGQALLQKLKGQDVVIRPPLTVDWQRTDASGNNYFGSRAIGNTIYFDPHNTFYGKSPEENPEAYRSLDPSMVLFHELLHIQTGEVSHQKIVQSDFLRLEENDYRRDYYASRGQDVVERVWDPSENHDVIARYDRDISSQPPYSQAEEFQALKSVLRADSDNDFIQNHQPKNPPVLQEGELWQESTFSHNKLGSQFIYLNGKYFPVKKINDSTFEVQTGFGRMVLIGRDPASPTEWKLKYPDLFSYTRGYYDFSRNPPADSPPPDTHSDIDQGALLRSYLDIAIHNGYAPENAPKYSYDIRDGDIVDSDGMVAEVEPGGNGDARWIYLNGAFWPVNLNHYGHYYIMTSSDTYDYIEQVPGYYTKWRFQYPDRYYQNQVLMTTVNNRTTASNNPGSPISYSYTVDVHDIDKLQGYLQNRTNTATPVTFGAIEEGNIVNADGDIVMYTVLNTPAWRRRSWPPSDFRFIYINGKYWPLAQDADGNLYIKTENTGTYKTIYLKGWKNEEQAAENTSYLTFPAKDVDDEVNNYFFYLRREETQYYNDLMRFSNDAVNAAADYEIALQHYLALSGKPAEELASDTAALNVFNAELNNENKEIVAASKKAIEKLNLLQKIRAENAGYIEENSYKASLRYDYSRIAEKIASEQHGIFPRYTVNERIKHFEMDYNTLVNKIRSAGREPDLNEKKELERIIFKINYCRLLIKLQNDDSSVDGTNYGMSYGKLPTFLKVNVYKYAITNVLFQIENDPSMPLQAKINAHEARTGAERVTGADIYGYQLDNCFFIPDSQGAKTGVLVDLDSPDKYYYIDHGSDLPADLVKRLPFTSVDRYGVYTDGPVALRNIRNGSWSFETYFNYTERARVNVVTLSENLYRNFDEDKKAGKAHLDDSAWRGVKKAEDLEDLAENRNVMRKAFVGSKIPNPDFNPVKTVYTGSELEIDAVPTEVKVARGVAHPFEMTAEKIQRQICIDNKDSVEEARIKINAAKRIGAWFDVTFTATLVFIPGGATISLAQTGADITADLLEGKGVDSLAVASLVVGLIPGGKVVKYAGKISRAGAQVAKYGILVSGKVVDAVSLTRGIKIAVETGDPLHIYQCLINVSFSAYDAKIASDNIFRHVKKLKENKIDPQGVLAKQHSAKDLETGLLAQDALPTIRRVTAPKGGLVNPGQVTISPQKREHSFILNGKVLRGRIEQGAIQFSRDNGLTWTNGGPVHMFAFVMQNAGGQNHRPDADSSKVATSSDEDSLKGSQNSNSDTERVPAEVDTSPKNSGERRFINDLENGRDPETIFHEMRRATPNKGVKFFYFFGSLVQGRSHAGRFEISKDGGDTWSKGNWMQEAVWRYSSSNSLSIDNLDKRIDRASKQQGAGSYSNICYGTAIRNAGQARTLTNQQTDWLLTKIAKKDSKGEVMGSEHYRQTFGLNNKTPLTRFSSANITESGFMHFGERDANGALKYDHIAYVHVTKNGIYLYQANGADFLGALNKDGEVHNNIGENVSKSHYRHPMSQEIINRFDGYFANDENAIFVYTPASEVQEHYARQTHTENMAEPLPTATTQPVSLDGDGGLTQPTHEPVIPASTIMGLTFEGQHILYGINQTLKDQLGDEYTTFASAPKENCANAAIKVSEVLKQSGYTNVRIVEMGFWPNGTEGTLPTNHYVVMANSNRFKFVVDLTAGQFEQYGFTGPVIKSRMEWTMAWQQAFKGNTRTLVKLAPVTGSLDNSPFSSFSPYADASKIVPGGKLLNSPPWYDHVTAASSRAQHTGKKYPLGAAENFDVTQTERIESVPSSQQTTNFQKPFGPDSFMEMGPYNDTVIIRAHGYPGDTGHYTAEHVAKVVRDYLSSKGIPIEQIKHVELQSCYGNTLGAVSQSQAIANHLGVKVKGYHGKFTERRASDPDDGAFYEPQKSSIVAAASNAGNRVVYHFSEAALSVRRKLGIGHSSARQAENNRAYPIIYPAVVPDSLAVQRLENHAAAGTETAGNRRGGETHPVTNDHGTAILQRMQEIPPHSKESAGAFIGGIMVMSDPGLAGGGNEPNRDVLKNVEKNLEAFKRLEQENDPDLDMLEEEYFKGQRFTAGAIEQIIAFIYKIRTRATDPELRDFLSGKLPERFAKEVPGMFIAIPPRELLGFYISMFGDDTMVN